MSEDEYPDQINYIVHPRYVERVGDQTSDDIEDFPASEETWPLYDELVLLGFPITNDTSLGGYYIDLAVRPHPERGSTVVVFTSNPAGEHDMGRASGAFISWQLVNDTAHAY